MKVESLEIICLSNSLFVQSMINLNILLIFKQIKMSYFSDKQYVFYEVALNLKSLGQNGKFCLKVLSATFLLVFFLSLK